jgi:hypothetical protein
MRYISQGHHQGSQSNPDRGNRLIPLVPIIASLAGILYLISQLGTYLNNWVQIIVILLFVTYLIIIIHISIFDIPNFINTKKLKRRHNNLARKYFPEFRTLTNTFKEFIDKNNDISKVLDDLRANAKGTI